MTPPLWQKAKRNWRASWWKWNRRMKAGLKPNIQKTEKNKECARAAARPGHFLLRTSRPASPPLARTHVHSLSSSPFYYTLLFSPTGGVALPARCILGSQVEPTTAAVAWGKRKEAVTGEKTPGSPPERSRLPRSCRRRGPPTCSPVPLPRFTMQPTSAKWYDRGTMSSLNFVLKTVKMWM